MEANGIRYGLYSIMCKKWTVDNIRDEHEEKRRVFGKLFLLETTWSAYEK